MKGKKKLIPMVMAVVCATTCSVGLTACGPDNGETKTRNFTQAEYTAYLDGVRAMPSRTMKFTSETRKANGDFSTQTSYTYLDAQNKKAQTITELWALQNDQTVADTRYTQYYAVDGSKAYYYDYDNGVKNDVTEDLADSDGATLWDKLVSRYVLNEDLMWLDLVKLKTADHPEGIGINDAYGYFSWDSSCWEMNKDNPFYGPDGTAYTYGDRWAFVGSGTFDLIIEKEEMQGVKVYIYMEENTETGKLLSKDYTDGKLGIDLSWEDKDGTEYSMGMKIRTFNLWYDLTTTLDDDGNSVIKYDTIELPEIEEGDNSEEE